MKVLIIDDHPIILEGCRRLLKDMGIDDISESLSLADGFRLYRKERPDVVIVDLSMQAGQLSGLDFIRRLRRHDKATALMVLSMHSDDTVVRRAIESGANAYVLKDTSAEEFEKAFKRVSSGERYLSHDLASQIVFHKTGAAASPLDSMSLRELQTLSLIAEGKRYDDIAEDLHVSYKTVVNTAASLKRKLDAKTMSELLRIAIELLPTPIRR
jgi:two-component system invasion response regulator UvrY